MMKKGAALFLSLVLLCGLCGCGAGKAPKKAGSIRAPSAQVTTILDEGSGTSTDAVRHYSYDPVQTRADGTIVLSGTYTDSQTGRGQIVFYYSAGGALLGRRDYTPDGGTSDYLYMADVSQANYFRRYDVQRQEGHILYLTDGTSVELTVEDGIVLGEDQFAADGSPLTHYVCGRDGVPEELKLGYSRDSGDWTVKVVYDNITIPTS